MSVRYRLVALLLSLTAPTALAAAPEHSHHDRHQHHQQDAAAQSYEIDPHLLHHHGGVRYSRVVLDRVELRNVDETHGLWDVNASWGSDTHRLWLKTEGEVQAGRADSAEVGLLYGRAIRPFWDLQFGLRADPTPHAPRHYGVVSLQGTAPYWIETDLSAYLSERGSLGLRLEAETEVRLTQRLHLKPRLEIEAASREDRGIDQGSGLTKAELELRLSYQFGRHLSPYLGISAERSFGDTRKLHQEAGEAWRGTQIVLGVSAWF